MQSRLDGVSFVRIAWRGGNFNNGSNDGALYVNWNTASNSNINYGARLAYFYIRQNVPIKA